MFSLLETTILLITSLFLLYKYITKNHDYFLKRNIPFLKPSLLFGNFAGNMTGSESLFDILLRLHNTFNDQTVYGIFDSLGPVFVLRDPELIKQVTVKDSDHFINHRKLLTDEDDEMFGNSIFMMRNEKWKDMRSTLTPAFTGNKMRIMFDLIRECCEDVTKYLNEEIKSKPDGFDLDLKDFFTRFTNDVIATCAFGIKVNSLKDRDNTFYKMGKRITSFDFWTGIRFLLLKKFKTLTRAIGMSLFDKEHTGYFKSLVLDAMKYREEHNIVRPDIVSILIEARKAADRKRDWTDNEIVSQCFGFFIAGFETTGTTMCFGAHELMVNPDIQEKLVFEINEIRESLNGKPITYEVLQGMKYMDMFVSEIFRKWPGTTFIDRKCNKEYLLNIGNENKITLTTDDTCFINIVGLHHDPENFVDPDKFDPERFSDENKSIIKPYTYLPFGAGPRNCIGNRFALMEVKAIFYYILSEFKFEISTNAILPLKLVERGFQLAPKGGFWVKICARDSFSFEKHVE